MFVAALGLIPVAIGVGLLFWKQDNLLAALAAGTGVLAGFVQALGLLRWVMLVPMLAANYVAPGASPTDQAIAVGLFDAANHYFGAGVGEHLGYLFTGAWTLLVSGLIWRQHRILAPLGALIAVGVLVGMAEPFGVPLAGTINALNFTLWALWTLVLGVIVLRGERRVPAATGAAA